MTILGPETSSRATLEPTAPAERDPDDWVAALSVNGAQRDQALRRLHALLVRAARHQVWRMRAQLNGCGPDLVEELALQSANEAMMSLLAKLHTFRGQSRFTTWAYKFAILQAAVEVRRQGWRSRNVVLEDSTVVVSLTPSTEQYVEAADLSKAITRAIEDALTPHQRKIMLALLVDEVPIDVLAERLGTNRNALYKTLHDGRVRVRAHLAAAGFLSAATQRASER